MVLPASDRAVVEPRKLRDYLLSVAHPVGRFKAAFFMALGYTQDDWGTLSSDLRDLAARGDALTPADSAFGRKYEIAGTLVGPNGKSAELVTVWIILNDEDFPRFVTAYPGARP